MQARSAMTRDVICITPEDTLLDAHFIMTEWRIRHLPIVSEKRLVGMLSDRDVLRHGELRAGLLVVPRTLVALVMTKDPITCVPSSTIAHVAGLMVDNHLDAVPVVSPDDHLVGLLTSSDMISLLRDPNEQEGKLIPFSFNLRVESRAVA